MELSDRITKHLGVRNGTGSRVYVVFRELPEKKGHCLVVNADALPDKISQNLSSIVHSRQAQAEVDFFKVLGVRQMPDTGISILQYLHENKMLDTVAIEHISMTPLSGHTVPLSIINEQLDGESNDIDSQDTEATEAPVQEEEVKEQPVDSLDGMTDKEKAAYYFEESKRHKALADDFKKKAKALDASVVTAGRTKSKKTEAQKRDERNAKRRADYLAKKKAKQDSTIEAAKG